MENGSCKFGDKCRFVHRPREEVLSRPLLRIVQRKTIVGLHRHARCHKHIVVPLGTETIAPQAFAKYCNSLTSITLPPTLMNIGDRSFANCSGLTSIILPDSLTNIGQYAFENCRALTSINFPKSLTNIGKRAFDRTGLANSLTSITLPKTLTSVGESLFELFVGLTSLTLPDTLTHASSNSFYGCMGLTSLELPNSLTSTGWATFANCKKLTSVVFRPRVPLAFITWAVGSSRNRNNWHLASLKQLRNVLRLIAVLAVERRELSSLDPGGKKNVFMGCDTLHNPNIVKSYLVTVSDR